MECTDDDPLSKTREQDQAGPPMWLPSPDEDQVGSQDLERPPSHRTPFDQRLISQPSAERPKQPTPPPRASTPPRSLRRGLISQTLFFEDRRQRRQAVARLLDIDFDNVSCQIAEDRITLGVGSDHLFTESTSTK